MIVYKSLLRTAGLLSGLCLILLSAAIIGGVLLPGAEIAYVSYADINPDIYLIDVNRQMIHNLTHNPAYDIAPAWSPDGQWIAFASDRAGRRAIYVMDRFGGQVRRLTTGDNPYSDPRWSADGQRLVFTNLNRANSLYRINFDGSDEQLLTDPDNPNASIQIDLALDPGGLNHASSPDGQQVAFMTFRSDAWGIYLSPDNSHQDAHLLVEIGMFTEVPVWSPDSRRMAFIARRDSSTDLYIIDVDAPGSIPRRLTFNRAIDSSPAWRP